MPILKEEKRRFPRINLKTPLRWEIRGASQTTNTVNSDISLGGLGFVNERFIAANTCVSVQINIESRTIRAAGRIANVSFLPYSDKYRLGIEFMEFDTKEKDLLSIYIRDQIINNNR